jgi:PAS domain S-box-containing protein
MANILGALPLLPPDNIATETIQRLQNLLNKQALREAHQRLTLLVDHNPLAVIGWNAAFEVMDWNPAAKRLFGYDRAEIIGAPANHLLTLEETTSTAVPLFLRGDRQIHPNQTKSGATILCEWHNVVQTTVDGKITGMISIVADITARQACEMERRQAEQQLRQANQDLEIRVAERTVALQHVIRQLKQEINDRHQAQQALKQANAELEQRVTQRVTALNQTQLALQAAKAELESRVAARTEQLQAAVTQLQKKDRDRQAVLQELEQAGQELRQKEAQYRSIFETVSDALFITDLATGKIAEANPAACKMHGYTYQEFIGMAVITIIHPDDHALLFDYIHTVQAGDIFTAQARDVRKDGTTFDIEITGRLCYYNGTPHGLAVVRDVSARNRAEAALRQSEQRFRDVSEAAGEYLWEIDANGIYTFVTDKAKAVKGYSPADLLGHTPFDFMPPEDIAIVQRILQDVSARKSAFTLEHRDITPTGAIVWEEVNGVPLLNEHGEIIGFRGAGLSITHRKQAEAALRQSEATQRALLNAMPDLMIRMLGDGTYLDFLPAKTFDCLVDAETIKGCNIADVLPPDVVQQRMQYVEQAIQTGEIQVYEYELTIANQVRYEEARIVVSGENEVLTIVRDISARKQAEIALEQSTQQLKQQTLHLETTLKQLQRTQLQLVQSEKMSSLGQLVAGIAHEINNPTSFIFGNLNHLNEYIQDILTLIACYQQHYPQPVAAVQETLEEIDLEFLIGDLPKLLTSMKVGAERIQQIVLSLRTFSRMDEAESKWVDIHSGIDSALMILDHRLKQKPSYAPISVIKDYANLPQVECYAGELNQVFMNVLVNAIDALEAIIRQIDERSANDHFPLSIQIQTSITKNKCVSIRIRDNGIGIPEAIKPYIFDPFFTTKPVGQGTGMGLATSYQIVTDRHGGSLTCVSVPGQSTEFTITIPLRQSDSLPQRATDK